MVKAKPEAENNTHQDKDVFIKYVGNSKEKYSGFLCPRGEYPHEKENKEEAETE